MCHQEKNYVEVYIPIHANLLNIAPSVKYLVLLSLVIDYINALKKPLEFQQVYHIHVYRSSSLTTPPIPEISNRLFIALNSSNNYYSNAILIILVDPNPRER